MQVGIVVRDQDATIQQSVGERGMGPWEIAEIHAGNAEDPREYGQLVERSWRLAVATVGQVQWELIESLDDESIYPRFLAEKGGGVHHLAVATPSFDGALPMQIKRGNDVVLGGDFMGDVME